MPSSPFDAQSINAYTEGPPRQVPGFTSLHRMASILLAERTPPNGRLLVLGAGGGLELKALAETHSEWSFDGVDPSASSPVRKFTPKKLPKGNPFHLNLCYRVYT